MVSILQMIIANAFGWQQIFQLQFKFQWSLFLWVSWQWFSIGSVMICHQTAVKPSHVLKMTQFTHWAGSLLAQSQSSWRTPNLVPSMLYKFAVLPIHWYQPQWTMCTPIYGSAQYCSNSSVLAMVLLQFCPKPSISWWTVCLVSMDAKMTKMFLFNKVFLVNHIKIRPTLFVFSDSWIDLGITFQQVLQFCWQQK